MAPEKVCTIIVACVVLHNMATDWKEPMLEVGFAIPGSRDPDIFSTRIESQDSIKLYES